MKLVKRLMGAIAVPVLAVAVPISASAQSLIRDAEIEATLRSYADPLFEAAGLKPSDVNIYIVQDDTINAMTGGGQNLFMNTGTIIRADTSDQLKGVMAHETGHMAAGHNVTSDQMMSAAGGTQLITMGLGALALLAGAPDAAMALFGSSGQFGMMTFLKYGRIDESQADQFGLDFLEKTGTSAAGLMAFFEKFRYEELMTEAKRDPYFRNHPISSDRIRALQKRAAEITAKSHPESQEDMEALAMMKAKLIGFIGPPTRVMSTYPASDQSIYAKYARAIAAYRATDIKVALTDVDELLKLKPDDPYFWELKGQILFESGKVTELIAPHRKSVELAPKQALLKVNLARSLATQKDKESLQEAEGLLQDAIALDKDNAFAWNQLADVYGKEGRNPDADLATAEEAYSVGDMGRARVFAGRAMKGLQAGTPSARRADDIMALSDPRVIGRGRGRGQPGLAIHSQP